ncbi:transposable element Tcb2 transposase [Trichonephila clavipes]|nr:transposable element Tcb2 transposase [Trichonephila clavipes]
MDESRFNATSASDHKLLCRVHRTLHAQKFVYKRDRHGLGVMVWLGIMHSDRTLLHILRRGSVMSQRYCIHIILDHVCIFGGVVVVTFLFINDNAQSQRSINVSDTLHRENILCIERPVYSPDLNPIEHAWDILVRRIAQKTISLRTEQEHKITFREEW